MIRRVEICVFSFDDAIAAVEAGADRLEICVNYNLGGISMPIEELTELAIRLKQLNFVNAQGKIKAAIMCRPRGGDFDYSANEFSLLTNYASTVAKLGFEALVSGLLKIENDHRILEEGRISSLVAICKENRMEFVFHRAFDEMKDPNAALKSLSLLGVNRVLSGWGQQDWSTFLLLIAEAKRLNIDLLPGGGIRSDNVQRYWELGLGWVHSASGNREDGIFRMSKSELFILLSTRGYGSL